MFVLPARAALEGVAARLEDVARLLGRGEGGVFLTVTLPLAARGIVAGAVLAFVRALGDFGATRMLAGDVPGSTRTASLALYDAAMNRDDPATALALAALLGGTSLLALAAAQRWGGPAGRRATAESAGG
jgi:molybdate transport system permease protein